MNWIQETWKLVLMQKMNFETTENSETQENFLLLPTIRSKLNLNFKFNQKTV